MTLEEYIEAEPSPSGQLRRRFRILLANLAVALGWALKRPCKGCAHRLFATARWLVPEAERFLVLRPASHDHHRRIFNFMADLGGLLSHVQALRISAGFLIVLVLLVSLELGTRATATSTQPVVGDSAFQLKSQIASENQGSVRNVLKPTPKPVRVSARQSEAVPLPTRKPQAATQKRMAQQKSARPKPMR
jgi:hypothetical protein